MYAPYRVAPFNQIDRLNVVYPTANDTSKIYAKRQALAGACYALSLDWLRRMKFFTNEKPIERMIQLGSHQNIITSIEAQLYLNNRLHSLVAMLENGAPDIRPENGAPDVRYGATQLLSRLTAENYSYSAIKLFDFSRMDTVLKKRMAHSESGRADEINVEECAKGIVNNVQLNCSYHLLLISFSGNERSGGHAMAFCMSGNGITFFDANRGEFEIPKKKSFGFVKGIVNAYFRKSISITVELLKIS